MTTYKGFRGTIEERLSNKLEEAHNGCWIFTGSLGANGYGKISFQGRPVYAHRVSWILHNGPIPRNMVVRHMCNNRQCCNPDHLLLGTSRNNAEDRSRTYAIEAFPLYHF